MTASAAKWFGIPLPVIPLPSIGMLEDAKVELEMAKE
jgi:hypothetical protein